MVRGILKRGRKRWITGEKSSPRSATGWLAWVSRRRRNACRRRRRRERARRSVFCRAARPRALFSPRGSLSENTRPRRIESGGTGRGEGTGRGDDDTGPRGRSDRFSGAFPSNPRAEPLTRPFVTRRPIASGSTVLPLDDATPCYRTRRASLPPSSRLPPPRVSPSSRPDAEARIIGRFQRKSEDRVLTTVSTQLFLA